MDPEQRLRAEQMAKLREELARDPQLMRTAFVSRVSEQSCLAPYLRDWTAHVERIGTLHFPEAAREGRIRGTAMLTVSVKSDGTVGEVKINRSSGSRVLDEAAIRIVGLAAPFAPFPPHVAKELDTLFITRTWSFQSANEGAAEAQVQSGAPDE